MNKHAFLIMAHQNDLTFKTLLKLLDDPRNDIYIHMDIKLGGYNKNKIRNLLKFSNVYHVERTDVQWGGYSQINSELILLKSALNNRTYSYFHLLSGEDLPLKKSDEIYNFFENNKGKEFVRFQSEKFLHQKRVKYYHFFQDSFGRGNLVIRAFNKIAIEIQKLIGVSRNQNIDFQKGTNWFSITSDLADFVIQNERDIEKVYKHTLSCDEVFLQTLVHNSSYKDRLYHKSYDNKLKSIMRLIDWERGTPYTFRDSEFDELINSPYLFARKFNSQIDSNVIEKLYNYLEK